MLMITPRSPSAFGALRLMCHAARRATLNVPVRLRSMMPWNVSIDSGPSLLSVRPGVAPPAVFTTTSIPSSAATAVSMTPSIPAKSVTSQAWKLPLRPSATAAPSLLSRSRIATRPPRVAISSAVALAIPDAPPTTTARNPFSSTLSLSCASGMIRPQPNLNLYIYATGCRRSHTPEVLAHRHTLSLIGRARLCYISIYFEDCELPSPRYTDKAEWRDT
ncbi:hypothetical protein FRAHR75_170094 [Frankia sp. Hr75.2]|nr:hypothetical protein FRAHR75_170094 [Frankia sp. Hr75.2]